MGYCKRVESLINWPPFTPFAVTRTWIRADATHGSDTQLEANIVNNRMEVRQGKAASSSRKWRRGTAKGLTWVSCRKLTARDVSVGVDNIDRPHVPTHPTEMSNRGKVYRHCTHCSQLPIVSASMSSSRNQGVPGWQVRLCGAEHSACH